MKKLDGFKSLEESFFKLEELRQWILKGIEALKSSDDPKSIATREDMERTLKEADSLIPNLRRLLGKAEHDQRKTPLSH